MTPTQCAEMFEILDAAYPKERMTERQMAIYAAMLAPYPVDQVREAVVLHIHRSPWFPRVSDVIDKLTKREELDPDQAWAEVLRNIRSVGYYGSPTWSHKAVAETVQAMGWQDLCVSENIEADRAHFMRFYQTAVTRQREDKILAEINALNPGLSGLLSNVGRMTRPALNSKESVR